MYKIGDKVKVRKDLEIDESYGDEMLDGLVDDNVEHPSHYTDGNIEVIDYIEDKKFNFNLGNAVKYISRAGKKNPDKYKEDLKKAIWYLNREVNRK